MHPKKESGVILFTRTGLTYYLLKFCYSLIRLIGNRSSRPSDFVNRSYDYRPNWIPLGPIKISIVNRY